MEEKGRGIERKLIMGNIFKSQEQREKWNAYNNKYSKENYKTISLKLNKNNDKDILEYIENSGKTVTTLFKELFYEKIGLTPDRVTKVIKKTKAVNKEDKNCMKSTKNCTNNIRAMRLQLCLTQTELAEAIGVTKQALSLVETGSVSLKMAEKIAAHLNVNVVELMGLDVFYALPKTEAEKQYMIRLINNLSVEND